jgi:hypothetical protein
MRYSERVKSFSHFRRTEGGRSGVRVFTCLYEIVLVRVNGGERNSDDRLSTVVVATLVALRIDESPLLSVPY